MTRFEIQCAWVGCGAYRWAIPPNPINWDGTWLETSAGWLCSAHARQVRVIAEAISTTADGEKNE